MTEPKPERPKDTTDYKDRSRKNLIAGIGLTIMLAIFVYAAKAFYDHEKLNTCVASGRRNCVDLNLPPREGVFVPPSQRND